LSHYPKTEEELYFFIFYQLFSNQKENIYFISKISKDFTQIIFNLKLFYSAFFLHFLNFLFELSSEKLFNLLSSFLFHFFYLNFNKFPSDFEDFIKNQLSLFIKEIIKFYLNLLNL
jgi:hypothetical protein